MTVFEEITQHLKQYSDIEAISSRFKNSNSVVQELGEYTVLCSRKIIDPDPENYIQYNPDDATIVGLFVKQHKGLECLFEAHKSGRLDVAWPYIRIDYEAYIKMRYLIDKGRDARRDYRIKSYKNRYEMYKRHNKKGNGVTDVFLYKFLSDIKEEGFTIEDFEAITSWKAFGGLSFEKLMKEYEPADFYLPGYALESDSIHSDWGDIRQLHLNMLHGKYSVKIDPEIYHGRVILMCIYLHLQSTGYFLEWTKKDFGVEILYADDLVDELKRVSAILMSYFVEIYENTPDVFVNK